MKVTHHITVPPYKDGNKTAYTKQVKGELIVRKDHALFIPTSPNDPYGSDRLMIHSPEVNIAGPEDDNGIFITGLVSTNHPDPTGPNLEPLYRRVIMESFYPVSK